ncbi:hypothetical protein CDQ83_01580 [Clostridium thermosuccinogenes]|nr:hypothetical protein CDQ83_01580 [Pseudoclostridium thermosuccinogenes]
MNKSHVYLFKGLQCDVMQHVRLHQKRVGYVLWMSFRICPTYIKNAFTIFIIWKCFSLKPDADKLVDCIAMLKRFLPKIEGGK